MVEAIELFQTMINNEYFADTSMMLFLNKKVSLGTHKKNGCAHRLTSESASLKLRAGFVPGKNQSSEHR